MLPPTSFSRTVVIASGALVLSGLLQLGTAWLNYLSRTTSLSTGRPTALTVPKTYTWRGYDFPNALDIELPNVAMTFEDSPHYPLDSDDADAEWQSIYPGRSFGFVRLGPEKRFFGLSVYHSLHCLNSLRAAILGRMHEPLVPADLIPEYPRNASHTFEKRELLPHADHCLGYLRQTILCSADLTLEPEYYEGAGDVPGSGATHVCRDWGKLYSYVEENAWEYEQWKKEQKPKSEL